MKFLCIKISLQNKTYYLFVPILAKVFEIWVIEIRGLLNTLENLGLFPLKWVMVWQLSLFNLDKLYLVLKAVGLLILIISNWYQFEIRDLLIDWINFIMEPLWVSVHCSCMSVRYLTDACWIYMTVWRCVVSPSSNYGST